MAFSISPKLIFRAGATIPILSLLLSFGGRFTFTGLVNFAEIKKILIFSDETSMSFHRFKFNNWND